MHVPDGRQVSLRTAPQGRCKGVVDEGNECLTGVREFPRRRRRLCGLCSAQHVTTRPQRRTRLHRYALERLRLIRSKRLPDSGGGCRGALHEARGSPDWSLQ